MANVKRLGMSMMAAMLGLAVTGCASTNVIKSVKAAPISYKVGDGPTKYASLSTRRTPGTHAQDSYIPARPMPARPQSAQQFDQASVDADLYKHQRIGKRYSIMGKSYTPKHQPGYDVTGVASWYGDKFHGKPTATGEKFDKNDLTAAHKTLPLNSMLFVTNVETGKTLLVRLNDRGPFVGDRIIDLSQASAKALGISGLGKVRVQYAGPADPMAANRAPVRAPVEIARPIEEFVEAPAAAPLRQPTMPYSAPQPAIPFSAPQASPRPQIAPVMPSAPEVFQNPIQEPDGQVTLTIKGPIHVASHTGPSPRLIRERLDMK